MAKKPQNSPEGIYPKFELNEPKKSMDLNTGLAFTSLAELQKTLEDSRPYDTEAFWEILFVDSCLRDVKKAIEDCDGGDPVESLALKAIAVGRSLERLRVRPLGKLVNAGVKCTKARSRGGAATNAKYAELRKRYQEMTEEVMAEGFSYQEATERVSATFNVSGRTVRTHTLNPDTV